MILWTPAEADVGEKTIEVRATIDGTASSYRLVTKVVEAKLAQAVDGDLAKLESTGKYEIEKQVFSVAPTADGKNILVVTDTSLLVLDASGSIKQD